VPLEVRPIETVAMIYYVMGLHSDLVLLLLEWESSSLTQLFEDAQEVEENIHVSRRIRDRDFFENLQVHEKEEYQYTSDFEQESNEVGVDLGQQQTCKFNSVSGSYFSVFVEYSRDKHAYEAYDQFVNQEEPMMTDDCIGNYMFLTDPCSYDFNTVLSSSSANFSEEGVVTIDDQNLRSREQEGDHFSSKGTTMVEQESNEVGVDLGQQQTCKFNSVSGSDFSVFTEYSRDRYACEAYDQFVNQEEPMMTDDCIGNYMFLTNPYSYDFNTVLLSSSENFSEEEVVMIDDQNLRSREQEGD
jgi:GAF domain-containing protein